MTSAQAQIHDLLAEPESQRFARIQAKLEAARTQGKVGMVLFGSGYLGKTAARALKAIGLQPLAFADNNATLAGTSVEGIPVMTPADAVRQFRERAVFVVTVFTNGPVLRQLEPMDVSVLTFAELAWCFPNTLLPYGSLERPAFFQAQADRIQEAYDLWADDASRAEYLAQIGWRTTLDRSLLPLDLPHDEIYFPEDLVKLGPDEVVVDCGAFDGDTLRALLDRMPSGIRHFYGVEPDAHNATVLRACMESQTPAIAQACTVFPCALGNETSTLNFVLTGTAGSHLGQEGATAVPVRKLDDLLAEIKPTFLKMDIEGAERGALEGAAATLRRDLPVLAICLYHKAEDLWDLPLLIHAIAPGYRLYLRRYCDECWEQVCYAIPPHRLV